MNNEELHTELSGSTERALKLWIVLNRAVESMSEPLRRQVEAHGLTLTEFAVLEALYHKGTLPIGEIGAKVLLTSGSMTYVIDKLERRELLERRACAEDRRVVFAGLTPAGRRLIQEIFPGHAALVATLQDVLTTEEQAVMTRLLKRLGLHAAGLDPVVHT